MKEYHPQPRYVKLFRPENVGKHRSFPVYMFRRPGTLDLESQPRVRLVRIHSATEVPGAPHRGLASDDRITLNRLWHGKTLVAECTEVSKCSHRPPSSLPAEFAAVVKKLRKKGAQILEETWVTYRSLVDREPGERAVNREDCVMVPSHRTER